MKISEKLELDYNFKKNDGSFMTKDTIMDKVAAELRKERAIRDISKRLNRKMSDEEKYKVIFDWCVNYFNYAYSGLYFAYAEAEWKKEKEEKNDKFYNAYRRKNSKAILSIDGREGFLEEMKNNTNVPKEAIIHSKRIVEFLKNQSECMQKENGYDKNNNIDTAWTSQYGVCQSFASIYEFLCNYFNLSCKYIEGNINSNGYNVGHAWNVVMINGKLKHIDISSAIHCKDKTNQENKVEDFFLKTYDELIAIDNGKSREITENSKKVIKSFISNSVGFDVGD